MNEQEKVEAFILKDASIHGKLRKLRELYPDVRSVSEGEYIGIPFSQFTRDDLFRIIIAERAAAERLVTRQRLLNACVQHEMNVKNTSARTAKVGCTCRQTVCTCEITKVPYERT